MNLANDINIGKYRNPKATGWSGWIEPKDLSWIVFIALDGTLILFDKRDRATGAVL